MTIQNIEDGESGLNVRNKLNASIGKVNGISDGATANATDEQLRDRSTHTGTQPASTVTGLSQVATTGDYDDLSGAPDLSKVIESDPDGVTGAIAITNIISLTQADYDAIASPDASTLYVVTE